MSAPVEQRVSITYEDGRGAVIEITVNVPEAFDRRILPNAVGVALDTALRATLPPTPPSTEEH